MLRCSPGLAIIIKVQRNGINHPDKVSTCFEAVSGRNLNTATVPERLPAFT